MESQCFTRYLLLSWEHLQLSLEKLMTQLCQTSQCFQTLPGVGVISMFRTSPRCQKSSFSSKMGLPNWEPSWSLSPSPTAWLLQWATGDFSSINLRDSLCLLCLAYKIKSKETSSDPPAIQSCLKGRRTLFCPGCCRGDWKMHWKPLKHWIPWQR